MESLLRQRHHSVNGGVQGSRNILDSVNRRHKGEEAFHGKG